MKEEVIVLATGCFDLIHPGHIFYLHEAKKLGTKLFVIVAHDQTVLKRKGFAPIQSQKDRITVVQNLKMVDQVLPGSADNYIQTALAVSPSIIALGADQNPDITVIEKAFRQRGQSIKFVRIPAYGIHSSGKIKQKIKEQK